MPAKKPAAGAGNGRTAPVSATKAFRAGNDRTRPRALSGGKPKTADDKEPASKAPPPPEVQLPVPFRLPRTKKIDVVFVVLCTMVAAIVHFSVHGKVTIARHVSRSRSHAVLPPLSCRCCQHIPSTSSFYKAGYWPAWAACMTCSRRCFLDSNDLKLHSPRCRPHPPHAQLQSLQSSFCYVFESVFDTDWVHYSSSCCCERNILATDSVCSCSHLVPR